MDSTSFVQAVRERLHPNTYPGLLQITDSPFELLLARCGGRFSHDVFGVLEIQHGTDVTALIDAARRDIAARFGGLCYRRSIVLHLLVHGPIGAWQDVIGLLCADRTGFRGVMIPSVYVVDPATGAGHKSTARWGLLRYSQRTEQTAVQVHSTVEPLLPADRALASRR
jgi:hypothetical protein